MRSARIALLLVSLGCSGFGAAQTLSAARDGQRPPDADPATQTYAGPLKLFDNLYYVGTTYVSAYLLVTNDGLILIDSLYRDFTAQALASLRDIGLDPADIRYVLITHGHQDHAGGVEEIRKTSGARVGMTAADWQLAGAVPDLTFADGDQLTLGATTIRFFVTPGHTPGVLSMQFAVRDGADTHQAFLLGGHNITSNAAADFSAFIATLERLQDTLDDIAVNLTSHPWAALIFERAALLDARTPGQMHPLVDNADFRAFLDERLTDARQRLARTATSR